MGTKHPWTRRGFLWTSAVGVGALWTGCGGAGSGTDAAAGSPDGAASGDGGGGGDALTPTCGEVTEANIEGPFHTPGSPERTVLLPDDGQGTRLSLSGRVFSSACVPLGGAMLDFWLADASGAYDNQGFELRGHQWTDPEGRYQLETIIPGHYLNGATYRPAHIHVKVAAFGFGELTTQLYFAGDPHNDGDPFIRNSLIMELAEGSEGKVAQFDFVLRSRGG